MKQQHPNTGMSAQRWRRLLSALFFTLVLFGPSLTQAQLFNNNKSNAFSDDYLLIVDIYIGKYRLAENVFIFTPPEATLIPLQAFVDAMNFPIEVDPVAMKAHGWFNQQDSKFDLDFNQQKLFIKEAPYSLSKNALILADDFDLYVDQALLAQWFSVDVSMDTGRLRINIRSSDGEPLPLERQIKREALRSKALSSRQNAKLPMINDQYHWLGPAMIDINAGYRYSQRDITTLNSTQQEEEIKGFYSLQASGDVLGMESYLSVSKVGATFSQDSDDDQREVLTFFKRPNNPDKSMLGGLDYLAVGDIFSIADDLIFDGGEGLGIDLQFGGVRNNTDFGKRRIEGDGPAGWEAELYRNGNLVSFQIIGLDGRYLFEDVAVEYGENVFDIRLFGPQGQERNFRESIRVGTQMLAKGMSYARLSYTDLGRRFIDKNKPELDEQKSYLQLQRGVTDWLAMGLTLAENKNAFTLGEDYRYSSINFITALPGIALAFNFVDQQDNGNARSIGGQTRLANTSISFLYKDYNHFISDRNEYGNLDSESELRFSGNLAVLGKPFSYDLTTTRDLLTNEIYITSVGSRLGFQFFNGRVTIDSDYNHSNSQAESNWLGQTSYLRTLGSAFSVRAALTYGIKPESELHSALANITWFPGTRLRTQLGLNKQFSELGRDSMDMSISYLFNTVSVSLSSKLQEGGEKSIVLSTEFSFGKENQQKWSLSGLKRSSTGRVRIHTYLDNDNNGKFSSNDTAIEGVKFIGRSHWDDLPTDKEGYTYLDGLSSSSPTRIKVDETTFDDVYWKPKFSETLITSHSGGMQTIELPVAVTVEVEGVISLKANNSERPWGGIPLYVKNEHGEKTSIVLSEFDGYFVIDGLQAGNYSLLIAEEALKRYKIKNFSPIHFVADPDKGIIYLDPIVLSTE